MQTAILKVLKDPNGSYTFPGGAVKAAPLFCNGIPIKPVEILIDSTFTLHDTVQDGVIHALELSCGSSHYIVLSTIKNIEALQSCCNDKINKTASLECEAIIPVAVFNVLGANIGTANTPAEYATLWNTDANNALVGTMFTLFNWTFKIAVNSGSFIPVSLHCDEVTVPGNPVCPSDVVVTSPTVETIHVAFTAAALKSYTIRRYSDSLGNTLLSSNNYTNSTNASQNATLDIAALTGGGTFYIEVREAGSSTKCTIYQVVVAASSRNLQWEYFSSEPGTGGAGLDTYDYGHTQAHVQNANFNINISDMQQDQWFVIRFPSDETNPVAWFNTQLNNGAIPDQTFLDIVSVAGWKYIKSRTAITLDTTSALNFTH